MYFGEKQVGYGEWGCNFRYSHFLAHGFGIIKKGKYNFKIFFFTFQALKLKLESQLH